MLILLRLFEGLPFYDFLPLLGTSLTAVDLFPSCPGFSSGEDTSSSSGLVSNPLSQSTCLFYYADSLSAEHTKKHFSSRHLDWRKSYELDCANDRLSRKVFFKNLIFALLLLRSVPSVVA